MSLLTVFLRILFLKMKGDRTRKIPGVYHPDRFTDESFEVNKPQCLDRPVVLQPCSTILFYNPAETVEMSVEIVTLPMLALRIGSPVSESVLLIKERISPRFVFSKVKST
jgi:hypothetical protein